MPKRKKPEDSAETDEKNEAADETKAEAEEPVRTSSRPKKSPLKLAGLCCVLLLDALLQSFLLGELLFLSDELAQEEPSAPKKKKAKKSSSSSSSAAGDEEGGSGAIDLSVPESQVVCEKMAAGDIKIVNMNVCISFYF